MDIEITGCRVLYSNESIAGRGVASLISWFGTAGPVGSEYIDLFNLIFIGSRLTLGYAPETRHSTNLQDFYNRSLLV